MATSTIEHIPSRLQAVIRRKLLRWYDRHKRDLPWRRHSHNPYAQWVAEIMLQQTRVDTVIPYYKRFLARFPNAASLARGRQETVLKHWEGLGYYRRALLLHKACRQLYTQKKNVPSVAAELKALPGIGDYTAAAIASISNNESIAAVDGNVARVLARLFGVKLDVLSTQGKSHLTRLANQLIPVSRPGDFNQAWMDFGSEVCTPRRPACQACPLGGECFAYAHGLTDILPVRGATKAKKVPVVQVVVGVIAHGQHILVRRRPVGGLWGGLWEFPNLEITNGRRKSRIMTKLFEALSLEPDEWSARSTVVHQLTHRLMNFHVFSGQVSHRTDQKLSDAYRWVTHKQFDKLSVSTAHRKIYDAANETA